MNVGQKEVFIKIAVARSDYFQRDGPDVHTEQPISMLQAALGGSAVVRGIYEDINLDVCIIF